MKHILIVAAIWLAALWFTSCGDINPVTPTSEHPAPVPVASTSSNQPAPSTPLAFRAFISGYPISWEPGKMLVFYAGSNYANGPVVYTWTVIGPRHVQQLTNRSDILSLIFEESGWATVTLLATDGQASSEDKDTGYVHTCMQGEACI